MKHHPAEREAFILEYLRTHGQTDVLDSLFHDMYAKRFPGYKRNHYMIGASPVQQAMRDLKRMYKQAILKRSPIGIGNLSGMGFPKWVYTYSICKTWKHMMERWSTEDIK